MGTRSQDTSSNILLIVLLIIFTLTNSIIPTLSSDFQQLILNLNIALVIGFIIVSWVKRLNRLRLPFLLGLSFTSGSVMSLLAGSQEMFLSRIGVTILVAFLILALSSVPQIDFSKRQLICSIGAFTLTLLTILLTYRVELQPFAILTTVSAIICFLVLLHITFKNRHTAKTLDFSSSVFLLSVGILLNLLIFARLVG